MIAYVHELYALDAIIHGAVWPSIDNFIPV